MIPISDRTGAGSRVSPPVSSAGTAAIEPNVEEALLIDDQKHVLMHYAGNRAMLTRNPSGEPTEIEKWQQTAIASNEHMHRFDGLSGRRRAQHGHADQQGLPPV